MLRIPTRVQSIRSIWPSEPRDFTPWLAGHLEVLDLLGLGRLAIVGTEEAVPGTPRSLDILARRPTGELVAIENQYGPLDHDHLTRGLAYAVGVNAESLVMVAEEHLNEFRAVAGYLNDVAARSDHAQRIGVYLVEVSAERVEEYVVPRFEAVESPNPWTTEVGDAAPKPVAFEGFPEFLAAVVETARQSITEVCQWWSDRWTFRLTAQSISLDRPHPAGNRPLSHFVLFTKGSFWLNRGYLADAGAIPSDRIDEFDAVAERAFPGIRLGQKRYYFTRDTPPSLAGVQDAIAWLDAAADQPAPHPS